MADEALVAKLKEGVEAWNAWRRENPEAVIDLRGADLGGATLRGVDLRDARARSATLGRADLTDADLVEADLGHADLSGARLADAQLVSANLIEANLSAANLCDAILIGASLYRADLVGAALGGADLIDADLRGADLRDSDLSSTLLANTLLVDANLGGADFHRAHLGDTVFGNTELGEVRGLSACEFHGPCVLDQRTIERSWPLPISFLRGCGLPDTLIDYLPSLFNQPIQFYSCFISYSHADKSFARRLHDQLQGKGIRCWLDEHQLVPGDRVADKIAHGIKLWDKVLLCCSETSLASRWVDGEIRVAFDKEQRLAKERGEDVLALIPLTLDGSLERWEHAYAADIRGRLAADFIGWEADNAKFEAQFEQVVKALSTAARPAPPEPKL